MFLPPFPVSPTVREGNQFSGLRSVLWWDPPSFYAEAEIFMTFLSLLREWYIFSNPLSFFLQVHNVNFAFELMQDAGLAKPKARPEGNDPPHSVC